MKVPLALVCTLLVGIRGESSAQAPGQKLPDGKGKAEFVHNCTACHHASMVIAVRKSPEDWRKSVDEMASRGTDGTKEDLDNVVLYLVTNYGTETSAPSAHPAAPAVDQKGATPPQLSAAAGMASRTAKGTNTLVHFLLVGAPLS